MSGGSKAAVYSAIGANSVVMVAKFIGFSLTGSGTMLAEAVHSAADVGNQSLLAVGMARAEKPADETHPDGYGRDAFVFALVSAVGIFFLGCGVSIAHGIHSLFAEGEHVLGDPRINLGILGLALVAEGGSLAVCVRGLAIEAKARGVSLAEHVRTTDDPFGVAVLLEDCAAVVGVLFAIFTVGLGAMVHIPWLDPMGSIVIGLLLGVVSILLVQRNRRLLIGQSIRPEERERLRSVIENDPAVESIAVSKAVVTGSSAWRVSAEIDIDGRYLADKYLKTHPIAELRAQTASDESFHAFLREYSEEMMELAGDEIDRIEARIREEMPNAVTVNLEPD